MKWWAIIGIVISMFIEKTVMPPVHDHTFAIKWQQYTGLPDHHRGLAGVGTGISNGMFLIAGGSDFPDKAPWNGGKKAFYNSIYVFGKTAAGTLYFKNKAVLPFALAYAASCTTPRGVIIAGGEQAGGASKKVLLLKWDLGAAKVLINELPELPLPLANAAVAVIGDQLYLAGGENAQGVSNKLLRLNLTDPSSGWRELAYCPQAVSHTLLLSQEGSLYLVGGRKSNAGGLSNFYDQTDRFDPGSGRWTSLKSLPYPLSAHCGVSYQGRIYVFGGDQGQTFHRTEVLINAIAKADDPALRDRLSGEKVTLQEYHPGFSANVLTFDPEKNQWSTDGRIPYPGQVTTTAVLWGNTVLIPCGEVKAGVRSAAITQGIFDTDKKQDLNSQPQTKAVHHEK